MVGSGSDAGGEVALMAAGVIAVGDRKSPRWRRSAGIALAAIPAPQTTGRAVTIA